MQNPKKRKPQSLPLPSPSPSPSPSQKCGTKSPKKGTKSMIKDPYPFHERPTQEECRVVRDQLLSLHGFPQEFLKYRKPSGIDGSEVVKSEALDESVLDGLVSTILSQNTTEANSQRAFASLKTAFPTWELVLAAESKSIEDAIRCGGLAVMKASCIKNVLSCLIEKKGKLCLEYLRDLSIDEIKAELSHFKGIGLKTVSCVLLFQLQRDDFPVDTHVFQISKAIGWIPDVADIKTAYLHLNRRIPDELKFDLNCLIYTHGKLCRKCTNKGIDKKKKVSPDNYCPLLSYCKKSIVKPVETSD